MPSVMTRAGMPATPRAAGRASLASLADQGIAKALPEDSEATVRAYDCSDLENRQIIILL